MASDPKEIIAENLRVVREKIADAAVAAGRTPGEIQLVAVTKYVDIKLTRALVEAGCTTLGESRPQQLWEKAADGGLRDVSWHLVGHLQRNKVERTLPLVHLIHSVDSLRLLQAIDKSAAAQNIAARVLLEVNTSGDTAKHGFAPAELRELIQDLPPLQSTSICGLMTMAALEGGEAVAEKNFHSLFALRAEIQQLAIPGLDLRELSMGMSGDFLAAIRAGSTMVRIGSSLFSGVLA